MITYIEYDQVYNDQIPTLSEIREFFSTLDSSQLLQLLCKANIALWKAQESDDIKLGDIQNHLRQLLFSKSDSDNIWNYIKSCYRKDKSHTAVFHRHQMLLAIKLCLEKPNINGKKIDEDTRHQIGKYLLAVSTHLQKEDIEFHSIFDTLLYEDIRKSISKLFYFAHNGRFVNNFSRAIISWTKIRDTERFKQLLDNDKVNLDIDKEFLEETNLTIKDYIIRGFASIGRLITLNIYTDNPHDFMIPNTFWDLTNLTQDEKNNLLTVFVQNIGEYRNLNENAVRDKLHGIDSYENNFIPLMEKPIINLGNGTLIISDPYYLEEKISTSIYWILLNKFQRTNDNKKARDLSKYFGLVHQEYTYQLLHNICDEVIEVKTRAKDGKPTCDFVCVVKNKDTTNLLLVEAKKIALKLPTTIEGNLETTIEDMGKIFREKNGFQQVYETLEQIKGNEIPELKHVDLSKIDGIFPLLITDRFIAEDPYTRKLYETHFFNPLKLKYQNLYNIYKIADPMFLSAPEMEEFEAAHDGKHTITLADFLVYRNYLINDRIYRKQRQFISGFTIASVGEMIKELDQVWNTLYLQGFTKYKNERLHMVFTETMKPEIKKLFSKPPENSQK